METNCEELQLCDLHTDHPRGYDTHVAVYITHSAHSLTIVRYLANRFASSCTIVLKITHARGSKLVVRL